MIRFCAPIFVLIALWPTFGHATNSREELEQVLEDLLAWLPGEYTSQPQLYLERNYGLPPDGEHKERYRLFARVDVPHIGKNVFYAQSHEAGPDNPIIPGTQVLYIATIDEERMAVNVITRRVKDFESYEYAHLDPEKLSTIEIDPDFGGHCDFRWQRHGTQIVGRLTESGSADRNGICTLTSRISGLTMTWNGEWMLNPWELWVYDNGYMGDTMDQEKLFQGRHDRTYRRLYKMRRFTCIVNSSTQNGRAKTSEIVSLHDRGSDYQFKNGEPTAIPLVMTLLRGLWPKDEGLGVAERMRLYVHEEGMEEPLAESWAEPLATSIDLKFEGGDASCSLIEAAGDEPDAEQTEDVGGDL